MIKLSILIPTVPRRKAKLDQLLEKLYPQLTDEVELLVLLDNKKRTLWYKRNEMLSIANGNYVIFADDDDELSDDYVSSLMEWIKSNADCVCYWVEISIDWSEKKRVFYSKELTEHFDWQFYYRKPNHLMCFKKDIAIKEPYSDLQFWEDSDYAERIFKYIETEHIIDKVLYHYVSLPRQSECTN